MVKPIDEMKIRHLDPKIRGIWALNAVVFAAFIWLFVTWISPYAFPNDIVGVPPGVYPFMFFMLVGIFLIPYLVWIELRYRNYTYYIADTEMIIRRGVLHIDRTAIPFEKVQNVNVSRSLLERLIGLATIKIETAGTNPGEAEGLIPGVGKYQDIVDEILEHVEHTRAAVAKVREEPRAPAEDFAGQIAALREEIARLREEKRLLEEKGNAPQEHAQEPIPEPPKLEAPPLPPEEPMEPVAPAEPVKPVEQPGPRLEFEGDRYKKPAKKKTIPRKKPKKGK